MHTKSDSQLFKLTYILWAVALLIAIHNWCAPSNHNPPFNLPQLIIIKCSWGRNSARISWTFLCRWSQDVNKILCHFVPCIISHCPGLGAKFNSLFLPVYHLFFLLLFRSMLEAVIQGHTHNISYITLCAPVFSCFSQLCVTKCS